MQTLVSIQHWLYGGMADGLGAVVGGNPSAILLAMAAAILFGAVHALMPGHGKTVLVSYHLGQPARPIDGFVNGSILAVTHVGLAVVLVLAGFRRDQPRFRLWRQDAAIRGSQRDIDRADRRFSAVALARRSP